MKLKKFLKMPKKSDSKKQNDFKTLIPEMSDSGIIDILKQRMYYQVEAKELAVKEAIKRGIINSEQDLFSAEYAVGPLKRSFFPTIESGENKKNITKSISRGLIICGLFPLIWGFLRINSGFTIEGIVLVIFGSTWIFLSAQLMRFFKKEFVQALFLLTFLSGTYLFKVIYVKMGSLVFMDFFIPVVMCLLISYGLFFLMKINR